MSNKECDLEVPIPNGKELRFRCGVRGCHASGKSYSMVTIYDHLARHYAHHTMSNDHFNFRCTKCGLYYYQYGLTISCACTECSDTENECVQLGTGYSRPVAHRHVDFYGYVKLHAVPVFDMKEANRTERSNLLSTPERAEEVESAIMRSPIEYNDGTRRTPLIDDEDEDYDNPQRVDNLPLLKPPVESSPHSSSEMRRGNEFGSTTASRPPCPPTPGPTPVPYPPPLLTFAGFSQLNFPCGVLPFTTMPNPQAPYADRSGSNTSTAQLNPASTSVRNPRERKGGTKFMETLPHMTPMKPGVLTPRRKRRSSRREDSDSN
ncbi:unnamed protein product [Angiostrongylus costaricensis]|uniref:C2H2-type domain-containing protein n=1 Tax=Angiostrongylus costaricensis TaxID=334426 RepID=A0A0R3PF54_ANGCS|nr:unnamed protein product [Angiostrongylus costaricensis]